MKIHTRRKRKFGLTSSQKHINFFKGGENKKIGDRTFKTKEGAKKWAEQKLKLKKYSILPAKKNKKFKIEVL